MKEQTLDQRVRAAEAYARYFASLSAEQAGYKYPPHSPERKACFDVAREVAQTGGKQ